MNLYRLDAAPDDIARPAVVLLAPTAEAARLAASRVHRGVLVDGWQVTRVCATDATRPRVVLWCL